jgi:hypothetical protein
MLKWLSAALWLVLLLPLNVLAQWQELGTPGDAAIYSLGNEGDTLYAGTQFDLIRSTDNGLTWALKDVGLTTSMVPALSITTLNGIVFAGSSSAGVYRSTDHGETWSEANAGLPTFARSDAIVYSLGNTLFLGVGGSGSQGFYVSTDGGDLWTTLAAGPNIPVTAMVGWGDTLVAGTATGRIYVTTNLGQTWHDTLVMQSVTPRINNVVRLGSDLFASTGGYGVFRSQDLGATWIQVNNGFTDISVWSRPLAVIDTMLFTGIDYSGNGGVWRSSNRGDLWQDVSGLRMTRSTAPPIGTYNTYLKQYSMLTQGSTLFAGTFGYGLFRSTDYGATWNQVTVPFRYVFLPALSVFGDTVLAGGPSIEAAFVSTDKGLHWEGFWTNLLVSISSFAMLGSDIYAGVANTSFGHGVYKSADGGLSWSQTSAGLPVAVTNKIVIDGSRMYAATDGGLYTSTDNGTSWTPTAWTNNAVGVYSQDPLVIVSRLSPQRTYRSTDRGSTWDSLGGGLPLNFAARSFARIGDNLFMCGTGSSSSLFRSTDNGANWTNITGTTSAVQVLADGSTLWVNGITPLYSTNSGQTWTTVSTSGITGGFSAIAVGGGFLYGEVGGSGQSRLYRRSVSGLVDVPASRNIVPTSFELEQNYPNPFNPVSTIGFSIAESGVVTLKVYDLLGREVAVLVNERKEPGTYAIKFDGGEIASGVYLYRLETARFIQTRKMILLK